MPTDLQACNITNTETISFYPSEKCKPHICQAEVSSEALPTKRVRRPPKRYRDEETAASHSYRDFEKGIKIFKFKKKLQTTSFSSYPKMAYLRASNGTIIGDLVEVRSSGKHPMLRLLCRECPEAFYSERQFRQHMFKHWPLRDTQSISNGTEWNAVDNSINFLYFCTLCEKSFHEHFAVRRHFKTSHNEDRPYRCEMCSTTFKVRFRNLKS